MSWQPIKTCPKYDWLKKKQRVLVRCKVRDDVYQIFQAAYDPIGEDKGRFWVPIPDNRRRKKSNLINGSKPIQQLLMYKPTHWMPLPEDSMSMSETLPMRDQFAMAALTGIIAQNKHFAIAESEDLAWNAYDIADAMLKARKEKK